MHPFIYLRKLLLFILVSSLAQGACSAHEDHEGLEWPPTPRGATNIVDHTNVVQQNNIQALADSSVDQLEQIAVNDPRVKQALGNRYTRATVFDKEKNGTTVKQMTFFSHAKNTTVEVEFAGEKVQTVTSIPASQYQPEITDEEAIEAEQLARDYFFDKDVALDNLEGFSILAYRPVGNGFYNARVIYVSFHENKDSNPQYMAWVDLTHERIIRIREEK